MTPFEGSDSTDDGSEYFGDDHEFSADGDVEEPDEPVLFIREEVSEYLDDWPVDETMAFAPESSTFPLPGETRRGPGDSPRSEDSPESPNAPGLEHGEHEGKPAVESREYGALINAALRFAYAAEQESLKKEITSFVALHPEHTEQLDTRNWDRLDKDVQAAAREIWTEAANVVARAVTELNQRREFLNALQNWTDPTREASAEDRHRQWQFWAAMKNLVKDLSRDLVIQLAKEALIEMLFPGSHIVIPPSGLIDAIFTACTLLEIADEAH